MKEGGKVILIGSAYPLRGGLSAFNERIIREYQHLGFDASIYTFSLQYPSFLFPGKTQYSTDPAPGDLNIEVKVNSINPFNWIKVGRELKKLKPDLVIVKFWIPFMAPCFGTIVRIIKRNRHTKVVSIIDNIIPHEHRPGDKMLAKYWVNSADGFVTMSKNVLDDLKIFTRTKPSVFCAHPIYDNYGEKISKQIARQNLGIPQDGNYLLFFGFIRDYKGLDLLLEAMADERIRKMNLKLIVAGEFYSDPKPYHDIIQKFNISEQVILRTDFIPESLVGAYFCASNLVVQPYKSATQSGVTQIAYHFDRPMIITNVGGLEEFITDGLVGYVVQPDSSSISEAIVNYFDQEKEEEFTQNVKKEKERFSWSNMISSIEGILDKLNS
ncbi:MAG: glycosyltransferase [Bacteroidetes bacterium]|nr:glycosyltransferase [Bacteroidota bacterium]